MKLKQIFLFTILSIITASCGLKKPLTNPDKEYPNQADCQCENDKNE